VTATYTISPYDYMTNPTKRSLVDEVLRGSGLDKHDVAELEYRDEGWWAKVYDRRNGRIYFDPAADDAAHHWVPVAQ
jgi:hypothetical protein